MTSEQFVEAIAKFKSPSAVSAVVETLHKPAGRKPDPHHLELSRWFNQLSEADRKNVELVIVEAVHMATFGLFTVVDGVSAIEEGPDNGDFELYWVRGSERVLLNPPTGEELHDLYNWFSRDQYHAK